MPPEAGAVSAWQAFLRSRQAVVFTHASLAILTVSLYLLLWIRPFWLVFVPAVIVGHRVGVLVHEYIHGIPFRSYRANLAVIACFDGALLMFGLLELFRGTHLAHHRWLNTPRDPAFESVQSAAPGRATGWIGALETVQYGRYLGQALAGRHPYVRRGRIAAGAALSVAWFGFWVLVGRPDVPLKLMAVSLFTTLVPVSLRGAIEHFSRRGDPGFSNEYRVIIPLFNLNRHTDHHENPRTPWYLLQYRTARPLWTLHYFTHWFHVHVRGDYVLMQPMDGGRNTGARASRPSSDRTAAGPQQP